jgi:AcrR family transcriptional regulator
LNPDVRTVRRDAILDVAERLIRTRGYDRMSVQDVQDELGVSRGAIYHYFASKAALVEAVIERIADGIEVVLGPIAADPSLSALAKLRGVFAAAGAWKAERRDLMLALLQAWYSDDNALVRERMRSVSMTRLTPILAGIVRQGRTDGTFEVTSPQDAARILVSLLNSSGETLGQLLLDHLTEPVPLGEAQRVLAAYDEAVERILGLPAGSFELVDSPSLRFWFT